MTDRDSGIAQTVTPHGEVQYETVTCVSCGNECPKQNAKAVVVGDLKGINKWHSIGKREYVFDPTDYQEGWACEFCRNDGLVDLPYLTPGQYPLKRIVLMAMALAFSAGLMAGGVL